MLQAITHDEPPRVFEMRTVAPDYLGLTPRQGDVLALVLQGLPNKRIALVLDLSESTVKEHVSGILQRLGVSSRVQAITLLHGRHLTVASTQPLPNHNHATNP